MKNIISIMVTTLVLVCSSQSYAQWKGYAGLNCLSYSADVDIRRSLSGAVNWDVNDATVYCPVIRDIATDGVNRIKQVNVRLFSNHDQKGGYCNLVSRTLDGATHDWQQFTWPAGIGMVTASFSNIDTPNWGHIALYCRLPGANGSRKSFVKSYGVEEQ